MLPPAMCRRLLSFLYLQRARIPETDLKHLTDELKSINSDEGWIKTLAQMLSDHNDGGGTTAYSYSTTENANRASRLLQKLKAQTRHNIPSYDKESVFMDVTEDVNVDSVEVSVAQGDVESNAMDVDTNTGKVIPGQLKS